MVNSGVKSILPWRVERLRLDFDAHGLFVRVVLVR